MITLPSDSKKSDAALMLYLPACLFALIHMASTSEAARNSQHRSGCHSIWPSVAEPIRGGSILYQRKPNGGIVLACFILVGLCVWAHATVLGPSFVLLLWFWAMLHGITSCASGGPLGHRILQSPPRNCSVFRGFVCIPCGSFFFLISGI